MPSREASTKGDEVAYDIQRLLGVAVPLLEELEAEGRTSFDLGSEFFRLPTGSRLRDIYQAFFDQGVTVGSSIEAPANEQGRVFLAMTYSSTRYGEPLADVVLREAHDSGNRDKLREPPNARARHLCVVVEENVGRAFVALRDGTPGRGARDATGPDHDVVGDREHERRFGHASRGVGAAPDRRSRRLRSAFPARV
jgi:hypothetical protein